MLLSGVRSGGLLPEVYLGVVDKYSQLVDINGRYEI